jgi:8-oxo-dGTP pyrophosphatase MutT (NUDIX family)
VGVGVFDNETALRKRFAAHLESFSWQSDWPLGSRLVSSAVLIGLLPCAEGMQILLTRRTDHLKHHAGQISFPGGHCEDFDASLEATALREAQEEIGLDPARVSVLGQLPDFGTPSGFRITPIVGLLEAGTCLTPDPSEVAEVFEVPLAFLANPLNFQCHRIGWPGAERHVYAVPWSGYFIWGATAGILRMLSRFLDETH